MNTTAKKNTSRIPVPLKWRNTDWSQPRAMSALDHSGLSTQGDISEVCQCKSRQMRILAPQPNSHNSCHHQTPTSLDQELSKLPSVHVGQRRAWEEDCSKKQNTILRGRKQLLQSYPPVACTVSVAESPKKLVSFTSELPTYQQKLPSVKPLSSDGQTKYNAHVPDVSVISGNVKTDGPSNWSTENRLQLKKQLTHRNGVVSRHKESVPILQHEQQRQHEKAVKRRHQLELSSERGKQKLMFPEVQHQTRQQRSSDLQQQVRVLEKKLAENIAECSNLQAKLNAREATAESEQSLEESDNILLQAQVESLQNQLTIKQKEMKAKEDAYMSEKQRLLSVQKEKESVKRQLVSSMTELARTQEQNASFHQRIATLTRELTTCRQQLSKAQSSQKRDMLVKMSQQETDRSQRSLSSERQRHVQLNEKCQLVNIELKGHHKAVLENPKGLTELRIRPAQEESEDDTLAVENRELKAHNAMLSADLNAARGIQQSLEKRVSLLEHTENDESRRDLSEMEDKLKETCTALAHCEVQLSQMKEKCQSLETSLETSFSMQVNESLVSQLESEIFEAKLQLERHNEKLLSEIYTSTNLKEELDCSKQECSALQDQLQLQRESATFSLNRIQQDGYKRQKQLIHRIKKLQRTLNEVEAAEKEAQSKCDIYMMELSYRTGECEKMKDTNALLSNELKEKRTLLRQAEQQTHQLSERLKEERATQVSIKTELSHEVQAHLETRTLLTHHKESLEKEQDQLKHSLTEKMAQAEQDQKRISELKMVVSQAKQQLSATRHSMKQKEKETQTHLALLKQDHQKQIKAMKLQLDELNVVRHCLQEKENMAVELEIAREALQRECQHLQASLDQTEKELTAEMHKTSNLCAENGSLMNQLRDLQNKVLELTAAQREYEDYAYKVEQTRKTEMQQMYEDVTQHLEQQSDSHQYLEKLRLENERVALQEKERQIKALRQKAAALEQQRKQEEVLMESLKFENQLMKVQLRRHDRENCEITSRGDIFSPVSTTNGKLKLPPIHHSIALLPKNVKNSLCR